MEESHSWSSAPVSKTGIPQGIESSNLSSSARNMTPITTYFSGEKLQCAIGIDIALLSIGLGIYFLLYHKSDFLSGVAYPFLVVSGFLFIICLAVVIRTPKDIARVVGYASQGPEQLKALETPRTQKVMRNFKVIKVIEMSVVLVGFGLVVFSVESIPKGIGTGLIIQSLIMFVFDHFAEARGKTYCAYLKGL
jgi:hypothetical protein